MVKEWIKISDLLFFQEGPGVRNTQYTQSGVKLLNVANLVNGKVDLSTSDRYISEDEAYGRYKHFLCDDYVTDARNIFSMKARESVIKFQHLFLGMSEIVWH